MLEKWRNNLADAMRVNGGAYINHSVNFIESLLRSSAPASFPPILDIVLTKSCNLRCVFCISYGSLTGERWMPFERYERIARELFPKAFHVLMCSGGEPFLYPRIRDALRLAREHRCLTLISSNGMLLRKEIAEWVVADQSLNELCISFDGATSKTLERIRVGADYEKILHNISYLSAVKKRLRLPYPRTWFRFVIMRSNAEELPLLFDICRNSGVYRVDVVYLNVANDMDVGESMLNHRQLAEKVFAEARRRAKEHGIELRLPQLPGGREPLKKCNYPWRFCQIDPDGSIRMCYHSWRQRLGLFQDGFEAIWRGEHYRRIRKTINCSPSYYPYCQYCENRVGPNLSSVHDEDLERKLYLIPGLETWQVPFNTRATENASSMRDVNRNDSPSFGTTS